MQIGQGMVAVGVFYHQPVHNPFERRGPKSGHGLPGGDRFCPAQHANAVQERLKLLSRKPLPVQRPADGRRGVRAQEPLP